MDKNEPIIEYWVQTRGKVGGCTKKKATWGLGVQLKIPVGPSISLPWFDSGKRIVSRLFPSVDEWFLCRSAAFCIWRLEVRFASCLGCFVRVGPLVAENFWHLSNQIRSHVFWALAPASLLAASLWPALLRRVFHCVVQCTQSPSPLESVPFQVFRPAQHLMGMEFCFNASPAIPLLKSTLKRWGRHFLGWPSSFPNVSNEDGQTLNTSAPLRACSCHALW